MKTITLIIAMVIGSYCWGQKKDSIIVGGGVTPTDQVKDLIIIGGIGGVTKPGTIIFHKQDTIKCLMLVCDTSEWVTTGVSWRDSTILRKNGLVWYNKSLWWQYGYEVLQPINNMLWYPNYNVQYTMSGFPYIIKEYLDQNKKPLPSSIVVWMTKEIK